MITLEYVELIADEAPVSTNKYHYNNLICWTYSWGEHKEIFYDNLESLLRWNFPWKIEETIIYRFCIRTTISRARIIGTL